MGTKKNSNKKENDNNNKNEAAVEKKKNDGDAGEKKKDDKNNTVTVVLKIDMHCEGCASKIVKCVRSFEGVETVKAETASNQITIIGQVDPSKIRDKLVQKTKKKIDLIAPQPKKDTKEKEPENKPESKPADDKKPKKVPGTTAVLKMGLHCQGCIEKIQKIVSKTKGVIEMSVDKQKDLVTVRGTMDTKALTETLKERLKRPVEIVPPKKEKENKGSNGAENKNGDGNGNGDGSKKSKGGEAADGGQEGESGGKLKGNTMENLRMGIHESGHRYGYQVHGEYEYGYPVGGYYQYNHSIGGLHHAPQMFSDENPNACAVM